MGSDADGGLDATTAEDCERPTARLVALVDDGAERAQLRREVEPQPPRRFIEEHVGVVLKDLWLLEAGGAHDHALWEVGCRM